MPGGDPINTIMIPVVCVMATWSVAAVSQWRVHKGQSRSLRNQTQKSLPQHNCVDMRLAFLACDTLLAST
eukprot:3766731-Rhodomonas_salina.2